MPKVSLIALVVAVAHVGNAPAALQAQNRTDPPKDAAMEAQRPREVRPTRPEQEKTDHDRSQVFKAQNADPSSPAFKTQPKAGKISGFDFYRDPLNADRPMQDPDEIVKKETANKAVVMAALSVASQVVRFY